MGRITKYQFKNPLFYVEDFLFLKKLDLYLTYKKVYVIIQIYQVTKGN